MVRVQAVCVVTGSVATLGYMYVAGKQMKAETGPASIYSAFPLPHPLCLVLMECTGRDARAGRRTDEWADGCAHGLGGRTGDRARRPEAVRLWDTDIQKSGIVISSHDGKEVLKSNMVVVRLLRAA